ncbi:molybdopterin molybdotransferase MoeA [Pseudodesulfovibrio sp.]|uniref:molybdopterin molybdotransferase MoeA n=1 Tax=unclassified Pseudodesulfovibrio TaxID=2661612 RepID=UPI003B00F3A0
MSTKRIDRHSALKRLMAHAQAIEPELVSPVEAVGRVAARDIAAKGDVPEHASSLRDGYAVRTPDIATADRAPVRLAVSRTIRAESADAGTILPGEAVRVLTGGMVPLGADAVLAEEDVTEFDGAIEVSEPENPGWFVRPPGGEVPAGAPVVAAGSIITPQAAAVLMRAGASALPTCPIPRVRAFALGSELADPEDPHPPASARFLADNLILVGGLLHRAGVDVVETGVLPDKPETVTAALAAEQPELVITSGGTGRSERDFALQSAKAAGFTILFNGVDIRPGRNVFGAVRGGTLLLGLPGPPSAVFACLHAIVLPLLRHLRGLTAPMEPLIANVDQGFSVRPGPEWVVPVTLRREGPELVATPLIDKGLPPLLAVSLAHGAALLKGGQGLLPGDNATVVSVCLD